MLDGYTSRCYCSSDVIFYCDALETRDCVRVLKVETYTFRKYNQLFIKFPGTLQTHIRLNLAK